MLDLLSSLTVPSAKKVLNICFYMLGVVLSVVINMHLQGAYGALKSFIETDGLMDKQTKLCQRTQVKCHSLSW